MPKNKTVLQQHRQVQLADILSRVKKFSVLLGAGSNRSKPRKRLRLREAPGNGKAENFSGANSGRQMHLSVRYIS